MTARPKLRVLGPLALERDGHPVALPRSKKTRALLAYLAITARAERRERLGALLWQGTDDPRENLRWSLTKLRALVDDGDRRRIVATSEIVELDTSELDIDLGTVRRAVAAGVDRATIHELRVLADLFRGELLEGIELSELPDFHAWCIAEREDARKLRGTILRALVARLPTDADGLAYARALVQLDPADEPARVALVGLLAASGRQTEATQQLAAGLKTLRARGLTGADLRRAGLELHARSTVAAPRRPEIQFCRTDDGVRIAYATAGSGPPLVKAANWLSHLELEWESPVWSHLLAELASRHSLLRYDERGCGLSEATAADVSLTGWVRDLRAVVDAARLERFPLVGVSQGCAVSIAFAVENPERVSRLVLIGGFARGWRGQDPETVRRMEALQVLLKSGWGLDNPAFRQIFTSLFIPGASLEQMQWFNELQRVTASPDDAARLFDAIGRIDVAALLPRVSVPTLVLHSVKDAAVRYDEGLRLATSIPGARFVSLDGGNHLILESEPAWPRLVAEMRSFIGPP